MSVKKGKNPDDDTEIIPTAAACYDCGGKCLLRVHLRKGVVIRTETDDGEEPQLRACLRGRAYRKLFYAPDRLQYPMKRVGVRGGGPFQRISWEEALDTIARELKRVKETYGCSAIHLNAAGATPGDLHGHHAIYRLLNMFGGCTRSWGGASAEALDFASRSMYGTTLTGSTRDDLVHARLIIMWGWNPVDTIFSTNTSFLLAKAREAGARIICVDPRFTDSVAVFGDQWIPIRPGTDAAMLIAMAHVMIAEDLFDQKFLGRYTVGFDRFRDYVTGREDRVPKTPLWAERITGVSAGIIEKVAREYATSKPAALVAGYAPGRTAYGEQYHRAAATLSAMTGNVGIPGGSACGRERALVYSFGPGLPEGKNPIQGTIQAGGGSTSSLPVGGGLTLGADSMDTDLRNKYNPHRCDIWDTILKGKAGGYLADIKLLWVGPSNMLNQFLNINKGVQALDKLEFILVHEQFMTATARFADILLPVNTVWERNDIFRPWQQGAYYLHGKKITESLHESKSDFEICCQLAPRLGISNYSDKTEDEWLRELAITTPDLSKHIPDYDAFKRDGVHKLKLAEPYIAFRKQVEDPEKNPFPTPTGKIEIYSQRLADLKNPQLPPVPQYLEPWESANDPLAQKYPLQLITTHSRVRTHSCFDTVPWLKELETQAVWLHSADAQARGIREGDEVRVFNDRGVTILPARVTERIMPGVVAIAQGAWYKPDKSGADRGGSSNILTKDDYSPAGGWPTNTCLVQVQKA
jgi:anaerobic dimethyl sulfoxide reductase subunit A